VTDATLFFELHDTLAAMPASFIRSLSIMSDMYSGNLESVEQAGLVTVFCGL